MKLLHKIVLALLAVAMFIVGLHAGAHHSENFLQSITIPFGLALFFLAVAIAPEQRVLFALLLWTFIFCACGLINSRAFSLLLFLPVVATIFNHLYKTGDDQDEDVLRLINRE